MDEEQSNIHRKSLARLMAVQALYSHELSASEEVADLLGRIMELEVDKDDEDGSVPKSPDKKLLKELIEHTINRKDEIDSLITKFLKGGWEISRLDNLLLNILRPAVYELLDGNAPKAVILDEYINIAHAFYESKEVGFINALLDSISNKLNP